MAQVRDKVFVIKSLDYSEADKILTLFGYNSGKFTAIAKGIRKIQSKNRGNLQTMSLAEIGYFEGRNMSVLRDSELLIPFDTSTKAIRLIERVLYMLNKMLSEDQPERDIFELLVKVVSTEITEESINKFRFLFLNRMGFLPNTQSCMYTGSTENLKYFEPKSLAVVSQDAIDQNLVKKELLWEKQNLDYSQQKVTDALDLYIKSVVE